MDVAREYWLFIPSDRWVQVWRTSMHFMVIVSAFFAPLRYALLDPQDPTPWLPAGCRPQDTVALVLDSILDVIFALDIVMTFNLAIPTPNGYVVSRWNIAKNYWTYRLLVMFREMQQSDKTNLIVIMLAKFVTCILLSTHLSACLFWGFARDDAFAENTWVAQGAPLLPTRLWSARYVTSLFWAVGTFKAGPASGDLVPTSDSEKILACVVMMANICLQTYLVSNLSALLTRADELESSVMQMLPELYRQRISSLLYSKLVRDVELFSGCAKRFLSQLHGSLTSNLYMAGHHLVYVDESSAHLYIISDGEVNLSHHGISVETRRSLETFSEFAFLCRLPEPFDVSSKTLCRILALSSMAWESAISNFPADGVQVMENLIRISKGRRGEIYKSIIRDAQTHIVHRRDMTTAALCFASASGDVAEVKKSEVLRMNPMDHFARTPLMEACRQRQMAAARALHDVGAQLGFSDQHVQNMTRQKSFDSGDSEEEKESKDSEETPQDATAHRKEVFDKFAEAAELCAAAADPQQLWFLTSLLRFRADANAGDYDRRTPLHLACASGNHGAVEVLLQEESIDMDCQGSLFSYSQDNFGRTPLMEAVRHGNESCARKLMNRGAWHGFCVDGQTDDANATHAGQELCQAAFSGQNTYLNNLISLCGLSNMDAAVTLVQVHADPNITDRWGHTALHEARENGHYDLVTVLERLWKSYQSRKKAEGGGIGWGV
eukprot:g33345.t1